MRLISHRYNLVATQTIPNRNKAIKAIHSVFFFYKNLFYKNFEAEINQNFKNVLRIFLRLRVDEERFYLANLYIKLR